MTSTTSEQLAKLVSDVTLLMLDFDGPICSVFAGLPASAVAGRLRRSVHELGVEITAKMEFDHDPLSIYRRSAAYGLAITHRIYEDLVAAEVEAAALAAPTPGAVDVMRAARESGRRAAVVSNNAAVAVKVYADRHHLAALIDHIAARRTPDPRLMKPDPSYLVEAATALDVTATECALVGDSVTDVYAAQRAGMIAVGYANKLGKAETLAAAGAIVGRMHELASAMMLDQHE